MLSCCEWPGVTLSTLLDDVGVDVKTAKFILAEGADGAALTRTVPMEMALAAASGLALDRRAALAGDTDALYDLARLGNVSLLHFADCHAQLLHTHFRERSVNIGVCARLGKPPHLVGEALLKHFGVSAAIGCAALPGFIDGGAGLDA